MRHDFKARVQYGDWKGTAAADDAHPNDFRDYLRENELIKDEEFLIGFKVWIGENHGGKVEPANVTALVMTLSGHDNAMSSIEEQGYAKVREVEFEMPIEKFIGFFKRFSFALSAHDMLTGKQYEANE